MTNSGVRPGSAQLPVDFYMLKRTRRAKDPISGLDSFPLYLTKLRETTSLLIDPSKSVLMELEPLPTPRVVSAKKDGESNDEMAYSLSISSFDFNAKKSYSELPILIVELGDFLFVLGTSDDGASSPTSSAQQKSPTPESQHKAK